MCQLFKENNSEVLVQRNPRADLLQNGLVGSPCSPRDSQKSSPTPQFKSINSLALNFLHSPTPATLFGLMLCCEHLLYVCPALPVFKTLPLPLHVPHNFWNSQVLPKQFLFSWTGTPVHVSGCTVATGNHTTLLNRGIEKGSRQQGQNGAKVQRDRKATDTGSPPA